MINEPTAQNVSEDDYKTGKKNGKKSGKKNGGSNDYGNGAFVTADGNGSSAKKNGDAPPVSARVESMLPTGSWQRVAAGVAAAAGGGLLAVATFGVGPAALAGAAGYLAYRGMNQEPKNGVGVRSRHED
jgi:hypothetical protein